MKKYAIIDMKKNGDCFEEIFDTRKEAVNRAKYEWSLLTPNEKKRREFFAVMFGEIDDDECFNVCTATTIKEFNA